MDSVFAPLLLKIIIPSQKTTKTIRIDSKTKIWELQESVKKKMGAATQLPGDIDSYGMFWYSESGPLWLADNSTLKSYNMKNGDSLEFKKRPANMTRPPTMEVQVSPHVTPPPATLLPREAHPKLPPKERQTIATLKKPKKPSQASFWIAPKRPGSAYDMPPVNTAKAPSSSLSSTSTPTYTSTSTPIPTPPTFNNAVLPEEATSPSMGIADLDVLIESFDDSSNDERDNDSSSLSYEAFYGEQPYGEQDTQYDSDDNNNNDNGSLSFNLSSSSDAYGGYDSTPAAPIEREPGNTFSTQSSAKVVQKAIEDKVSVRMVERILEDAIKGIDEEEDISFIKMYLTSALAILRSVS